MLVQIIDKGDKFAKTGPHEDRIIGCTAPSGLVLVSKEEALDLRRCLVVSLVHRA